ncbi:CBS and ACT domain-containing protein [Desulfosarcina sp. OttesenSCG-928-G10]|nr:CBS and ACT domain-containing protein [Desulfosarcina sp. OttesenSCG-928-G10]
MLVKFWMNKPVITLEQTDPLQKGADLMREKHIRRLPVMDNGRLCGIVSDRDLRQALASDGSGEAGNKQTHLKATSPVSEIMTQKVRVAHPDWTIEEVADLLLQNKISGAPVVDDEGKLCGIITQSDLFKSTLYLTGLKQRGFHLALVLEDRPGSIMEIVNVIRQFDGRMASILSTYDRAPNNYRNVYLRFYGVSRDRLDDMLNLLREKARLRYIVDHRENRRTMFSSN